MALPLRDFLSPKGRANSPSPQTLYPANEARRRRHCAREPMIVANKMRYLFRKYRTCLTSCFGRNMPRK